ncbi:MAG: acyl-CoA dehydratase activase [Desulfovibrionaceae bacterium]
MNTNGGLDSGAFPGWAMGLDVGAVAAKIAVVDRTGELAFSRYLRHGGRPLATARALLADALDRYPGVPLAVTGAGGKTVATRLGAPHVNELLAIAAAMRRLHPEVSSVIEMGGEDAKYLVLDGEAILDFSLNSVCAAGTGSFLDQQAERLRLSIGDFAAAALASARPPRVAGRCSVFAKSDMIHLQQIATPLCDVVAGLCFAVARNFKGAIIRNRPMPGRVAFLGGVACNAGMVRAFTEVLGLAPGEMVIPDPPTVMCAAGAALKALADGTATPIAQEALDLLQGRTGFDAPVHAPLVQPGDDFAARHVERGVMDEPVAPQAGEGRIPAWLGIDIGSISTNLAVVDAEGNLLSKRYLRTAGQPIEAVRTGLREVGAELAQRYAGRVAIEGVGTTGSGRYMIADYVRADVVRNEITAQATAAVFIDPSVDTIFEIGGQDSKFISLDGGVIADFEMNKACAAGTGSFLEEQAEKLGVPIKDVFASRALAAAAPCRLGERCTVFMENSLMDSLGRGAGKDDLLAGLSYSIVENYINRVVAGRRIGGNIFFQGGTAFNKAVVAAFEKFLGRRITVPPHHDVTGAIGMGLIARDHMRARGGATTFKGFAVAERGYGLSSFECKGCDNRCEINRVSMEGEDATLFYGGRCEKYDIRRQAGGEAFDLFTWRREMLEEAHHERAAAFKRSPFRALRGRIGLPRVFFFHDYLPYFATLLWYLGFEVVLSPPTNAAVIHQGVQATMADTCFPVKAALGHVRWLAGQDVHSVFVPSFVDMAEKGDPYASGQACPLTQSFPYQARAAFPDTRIIAPVLSRSMSRGALLRTLRRAFAAFNLSGFEMGRALRKARRAQARFEAVVQAKGREVLAAASGKRLLVVMGRAYNAFDSGLNLDIPKKLATLGVTALPMDFLPGLPPGRDVEDTWPEMYWRSGQRLLRAARQVRGNPDLEALFIGNFSCGPDSFIHQFVTREMRGKPYLHLEIDEHSADAGVITRCEAFLDSLAMRAASAKASTPHPTAATPHPTVATPHPTVATSHPTVATPHPTVATPHPTVATPHPTVATPHPTVATPSPAAVPGAGGNDDNDDGPITHRVAFALDAKKRHRRVYIPSMCDHAHALAAAFEICGVAAEVLPPTDAEAIALGRKHVTGKECYPFAVTTGDMLKKALAPDFEPDRAAFLMFSGVGPCRFGQYNVLQRLIMDRVGLGRVPIFSPSQDVAFYAELGIIGTDYARKSWEGVVAIDLLTKLLHETRPFEREPGAADALYADALARVRGALVAANGDRSALVALMRAVRRDFEAIPRTGESKPLIGIVGEIFVRSNRFSNEDLVRQVEALGGEAWLAPIDEWVHYVNWGAMQNAIAARSLKRMCGIHLKARVQHAIAADLEATCHGYLKTIHDPPVSRILKNAAPWLHHSFRGEAVLSVGKSIDMAGRGASGIINAMPFGCMPGTVVTSLMRTVAQRLDVPCISIPFDGTPSPTMRLQLEAFMEQARRRSSRG